MDNFSQSKMYIIPLVREEKSKCAVANGRGTFAARSEIRCRGFARHGMKRGRHKEGLIPDRSWSFFGSIFKKKLEERGRGRVLFHE